MSGSPEAGELRLQRMLRRQSVAFIVAATSVAALACGGGASTPPPSRPVFDGDEFVFEVWKRCMGAPNGQPLRVLCHDTTGHPASPDGTMRLGLWFDEVWKLDAALAEGPVGEAALAAARIGVLEFHSGGVSVGGLTPMMPAGTTPPDAEAIDFVRGQILACLRGTCPSEIRIGPAVAAAAAKSRSSLGQLSVDGKGHPRGRTGGGHGYPRYYDLGWSPVGPGWWVVGVGSGEKLTDAGFILDLPLVEAP